MTLDEFIKVVRPGITMWGVLLTFAVTAFAIAKFFWNYEKDLVVENVERVKALLDGFRAKHIEPIIVAQLRATLYSAYDVVKAQLLSDLYVPRAGQPVALPAEKELRDYLTIAAIETRFSCLKKEKLGSFEQFSESAEGEKFYDSLDHCYERARSVALIYEEATKSCNRLSLACAGLGLLFMLGISQVLYHWPGVLYDCWVFASAELFVFGLWYFARLEFCRRKLLRLWKEFEIYGTI
jgi:hypothetical protein